MPKQCFDLKDFVQNKLINRAKKVIIVHTKNKTTGKRIVKIKSRTPSYLYTFVCDENKARKIESAIPAGIEKEIIKGGKRRTK
ncbi:MAG: hypothetical protein KVP17_003186 [Porospora cf. gigantea B]|uniref:uncharacterized protein n=1 Tax=Porospora cf. gigantea B TaxID=2853592 RepID=UPI003571E705|nr:MAG: hypothetical protein KVP17_003186 [Porospora cf. gigantea B]